MKKILALLSLALLSATCTRPTDPREGQESSLLLSSSFEVDGTESLDGWTYDIQLDTSSWPHQRHVNFSNDAPPLGGSKSIEIGSQTDGMRYWGFYVTYDSLQFPEGRFPYRFSFWAKTLGVGGTAAICTRLSPPNIGFVSTAFVHLTDTTWKEYSLVDTISGGQQVFLYLGAGHGIFFPRHVNEAKVNFDLCKLERIP